MKFASPTVSKSLRCLHQQPRVHLRQVHKDASKEVLDPKLPLPKLDYKAISEDILYKTHNAVSRKAPVPVGAVQTAALLYADLKVLSSELNHKLALRNSVSQVVQSSKDPEEKKVAIEKAKGLKASISELKIKVGVTEAELLRVALPIPNDTHPDTPIGPEEAAITLSTHGPEPIEASPLRDHVKTGRALDIIDFDSGSAVTGSSWYYLLNEGAILETALVNYALSVAMKYGYRPVTTPDVVKTDIAARCGFQPRDTSDVQQMYHLASESGKDHPELVLAATAEMPLAGLFANKVYEESQLPIKVVGLGKAFRAEAGARGADTRGLYRVHQFTKVELFAVTGDNESNKVMDELKAVQIDILEGLNIPFRVLDMPSEELGASAYRKYDIEAWMPGRGRWGEVTSTSNCTDYQARRLHIRYRRRPTEVTAEQSSEKMPLPFAHTLNGTGVAVPRLIVTLLENGARLQGEEVVGLNLPKALQRFWIAPSNLGKCEIRWS